MASFNKFYCFVKDVGLKVHNLGTDVLKVLLTNTAPAPTNAVKTELTEMGAGNGYTAGGLDVGTQTWDQAGGTAKLVGATDPQFVASGGNIGPFQYAVLYNSTATNGNLIGWWDYGSPVTLQDGESFLVDLDQVNGILTLA